MLCYYKETFFSLNYNLFISAEASENRIDVQSNGSDAMMDRVVESTNCVFCGRKFHRKNGRFQRTIEAVSQHKSNRIIELLEKTSSNTDFNCIKYHVCCFNEAVKKSRRPK